METVIKVEGLGKRYHLGEINRQMLYLELQSWWAKVRGREDPNSVIGDKRTTASGDFWALRDISFEVQRGDVVGIIGRNGSGKSTLLKILSEVTTPTRGKAYLKGTVASLLEVGTGFHNELTGRENVYLNGAILGMSRKEIDAKYDQIADFAGVEEFMDTPVKRYSSGMKLRLAFSVAAHLEPEVLILDEVLAVGDANFQHKCLGRIGEVAKSGRTILFVSHNMSAVQSLCNKGIILDGGRMVFSGTSEDAVAEYMHLSMPEASNVGERTDRAGSGEVRLADIELCNAKGERIHTIPAGGDVDVVLTLKASSNAGPLQVRLLVRDQFDTPLFIQVLPATTQVGPIQGSVKVRCRLFQLPLVESTYRIDVRIRNDAHGPTLDEVENAVEFHIERSDLLGSLSLSKNKNFPCLVRGEWSLID